jgi:hypothetical protein
MDTMIDIETSEIDKILERFRQGQLTEESLRTALERRGPAGKRQDLLYLAAINTAVTSPLLSMSLVRDGQMVDGMTGNDEWPYGSVLDAIRDGWRVIKFPELALLLYEGKTAGLGCEFILEKWS